MSYFSCDIPYMSDKELKENGIHISKDISDNNIENIEYICRQDMLDAVEKLDIIPSVNGMGIPTDAEDFRMQFLGTVLKVNPADVAPVRHGKWIFVHPLSPDDGGAYLCSECEKGDWDIELSDKFCKFCGAKMDGEE